MFTRINLYGVLFIIGFITILGFGCHPATATTALEADTDYYNHTTDLTPYIAEAKRLWIAENGDAQPNLTAAQEQEVRLMVAKMQSEARQ